MLFIAKRLYRTGVGGHASASAVRIATAGVAVGIMVMIVSICVTLGFQREIKNRVAALVGHIQVINAQSLYRNHSLPIQITDLFKDSLSALPHVKNVQRFILCPGMLKTEDAFRGIFLRGVDADFDTTFISSNLISGKVPSFGVSPSPSDSILLSAEMASALRVQSGERIYSYFFDNTLRARRFVVSGIYETNMADFDGNMCYVDARTVQRLSGWNTDQYSGAEIVLDNFTSMNLVAERISSMLFMREDDYGQYYSAPRVDELFPQIFSWLALLDTNVVAILVLMICVAGVTMVSGLLVIILERTRFIGIMKSMGTTNAQLRRTFLYLSAMIVLRGIVYGNVVAFALLVLQSATGIVSLDPTNYYLSQVPVYYSWTGIILVNILTLIVCVSVLIVPTFVISRIHPARSIRFE